MPNRHRISIDLDFNGPQANLYGVPPAQAAAFEAGDLVGDTRRGGSCNFEHVQLIPHCNGTHTECIGHITDARVYISDVLTDSRFPGQLVTVAPKALDDAPGETYNACATPQDRVITREQLAAAIDTHRPTDALVVRTLPNPPRKPRTTYTGEPPMPPYFTHEAMELITRLNVQHLIVDLPVRRPPGGRRPPRQSPYLLGYPARRPLRRGRPALGLDHTWAVYDHGAGLHPRRPRGRSVHGRAADSGLPLGCRAEPCVFTHGRVGAGCRADAFTACAAPAERQTDASARETVAKPSAAMHHAGAHTLLSASSPTMRCVSTLTVVTRCNKSMTWAL